MENIEIEIKLKLDNPEIVLRWLQENATLIKTSDQVDYYFNPPHKTFIYNAEDGTKDADEWFRIRVSENGNEICYKYWYRDEKTQKSLYADEIETSIGDEKQILEILRRLGFKPTSTIRKHRESYRYKEFQFDCDTVEELGYFVEIEFRGELEDPTQGKQKIFDLLNEIGITNWQKTKRGYSWIQWNPGKNHFDTD
ncbi:class IV adenylate cyclase [Candidatus Woesearchaeota archaeon CG10_big_fil_rev_8_21_14_0_10_36_11]|nr:MAG: class IV adenylate cyclase [Candidatus Woesearchaeota archaeon CG10_big_fil_rev_8_21_14_0_10_36_11]